MSLFLNDETAGNDNLIRSILADFSKAYPIRLIGGSRSYAFRVGEYVARFPKDESVLLSQKREVATLAALRRLLSDENARKIPEAELRESGGYCFCAHRLIKGKICDSLRGETAQNTCYAGLSDRQKALLAGDIAAFLAELHSVKTDSFTPAAESWDFTTKSDFDEGKSGAALVRYAGISSDKFKVDVAKGDFVFGHNDLSGSNLIIDESAERVLRGVIDFGNAGIMPRINDFVPLYKINCRLARQVVKAYNDLSSVRIDLRQTDYLFLCFCGHLLAGAGEKSSKFIERMLAGFAS